MSNEITHFPFAFVFDLQAAGKYRQQGRNYIVEDGDIIFFKFNTPQQPKKKWISDVVRCSETNCAAPKGKWIFI